MLAEFGEVIDPKKFSVFITEILRIPRPKARVSAQNPNQSLSGGLNREEAAKYGQTREGMRLYRSSTGKSSLYVDEKSLGSGKPSVKIGDEWRPICSITPSAQADGSYVFKETGRGNDWKVVFDKDAGTYSAKKSD